MPAKRHDLSAMGGVVLAVNRDRLWCEQRLVVFAIDDLATSNRPFSHALAKAWR